MITLQKYYSCLRNKYFIVKVVKDRLVIND